MLEQKVMVQGGRRYLGGSRQRTLAETNGTDSILLKIMIGCSRMFDQAARKEMSQLNNGMNSLKAFLTRI